MTAFLAYLGLALIVSFLCSLLEASLLSIPNAHVSVMVSQNQRAGHVLERMKRQLDEPLSAILTWNTIAHTVGAAGVGAEAASLWGDKWVGVVSAILTFLILVFTEIFPKTFGSAYCKDLAAFTAYTVRFLEFSVWPLVRLLRLISGLFHTGSKSHVPSREELLMAAKLAASGGGLHATELKVIQNLIGLQDIAVKDVMTPWSVVKVLRTDLTVDDVIRDHSPLRFSRLPVEDPEVEDVVGVVLRYRILDAERKGQGSKVIKDLVQPIHAVPETMNVGQALNDFIQRKEMVFMVIDEHSGPSGLMTLEDALETLLGVEIVDELDPAADMRELARKHAEERRQRRISGTGILPKVTKEDSE